MDKPRILLVDDEPNLRLVLKFHLKREFIVDEAENGVEALEKIKKCKPKVVISDYMMPKMDGLELFDVLSEKYPEIIKILQSAVVEDKMSLLIRAVNTGKITAFFHKPVETQELIRVIKKELALVLMIEQNSATAKDLSLKYLELQAKTEMIVLREKSISLLRLAAGMAHEINNPLSFISTDLTLLEADFKSILENITCEMPFDMDKKQKKIMRRFDRCRIGYERIAKIIKSLRDFSGLDSMEQTEINLNNSISAILILLESDKPDKIKIETIMDKDLKAIVCLEEQINQAIYNVILNAYQAVDEGGLVELETGNLDDNTVFIRIADNGPGISHDIIENIFEPFFTAKPIGSGTGLGLSIAKSVLENHGGTITLESIKDPTEFIITLKHSYKEIEAEIKQDINYLDTVQKQ